MSFSFFDDYEDEDDFLDKPEESFPGENALRAEAAIAAKHAEACMDVARANPTRANIQVARKAWDAVPSSVGYDVSAIAGHEELDELEGIPPQGDCD